MDNFHEQLATTHKTGAYKFVNAVFYVFGVLALLTLGNLIIFAVCAILAAGAFFLRKKLYVEFEYVFTNGDIDVDKIVEMKKRSKVISFDIKNVELLAPEDSYEVKDFSNKPSKVVTCYPSTNDKKVYIAMVTGGNERMQVRFAPDEELINLCFKYNPRAVKKN